MDMELIVATSMLGYPGLVFTLGGDPGAILAPLGLRAEDCGNPDVVVPLRSAIHAAERAAAETATPDFGRRLADRQSIEILGPVGIAAGTADNVGTALAIFERFMAAYCPQIAVRVSPGMTRGLAFWEWRVMVDPPVSHPQTEELSLGIMLGILRLLLGAAFAPVSVHLTHAPLTPPRTYRRYFGCPAEFHQPAAGFVLATADLERPMPDQSRAHRVAMDHLNVVIGEHGTSAARSVARLAAHLLPGGAVTVEMVAGQFGMHPKALQRRLAVEGTSFSEVIDQVRRGIAARLLRDTDIGLIHLTHQLGFAEQAVLTRACRRWFGRAPSAYRSESRMAAAGGGTQISRPLPPAVAASCRPAATAGSR